MVNSRASEARESATPPALDELQRELRAASPRLRTPYGVRSLSLFGSRPRGEGRADSDLDVLVEFDVAPLPFRFIELEPLLSDLLQVGDDLVMKSAHKPALCKRIVQETVPI